MGVHHTHEPGDSSWVPITIVLVILVVALLGYFAWYAPARQNTVARPDITVNTPPANPPDNNTIVVPAPGAAGPAGSPGPAGPAGPAGTRALSGTDGGAAGDASAPAGAGAGG
ncbi:MAG: hypothetical protein IT208_13295 [Chthonomonadales bacterium]|nr:hypothetical protein [Chthonomonadales bacterium]